MPNQTNKKWEEDFDEKFLIKNEKLVEKWVPTIIHTKIKIFIRNLLKEQREEIINDFIDDLTTTMRLIYKLDKVDKKSLNK